MFKLSIVGKGFAKFLQIIYIEFNNKPEKRGFDEK
jgi:hypothetical protein